MPRYEIRPGADVTRKPTSDKEEHTEEFTYSSYDIFVVRDDGTEGFLCSCFGGCSHMAADMVKVYFESQEFKNSKGRR